MEARSIDGKISFNTAKLGFHVCNVAGSKHGAVLFTPWRFVGATKQVSSCSQPAAGRRDAAGLNRQVPAFFITTSTYSCILAHKAGTASCRVQDQPDENTAHEIELLASADVRSAPFALIATSSAIRCKSCKLMVLADDTHATRRPEWW